MGRQKVQMRHTSAAAARDSSPAPPPAPHDGSAVPAPRHTAIGRGPTCDDGVSAQSGAEGGVPRPVWSGTRVFGRRGGGEGVIDRFWGSAMAGMGMVRVVRAVLCCGCEYDGGYARYCM